MAEFGPMTLFASEVKHNTYNNPNSTSFASEMKYNISDNPNWTDFENFQIQNSPNFTEMIIFNIIILTLCFLGLLGNGKVIWILGFHMKRNSFSIYVLNLAVADSGILIILVLMQISQILNQNNFNFIFLLLYFVLYNTSQLLLISISVDRCVSVLFPIWHQCHRPPKLSLIVCAITWVLPIVYFALEMIVIFSEPFLLFQLVFNGLVSYPLVVISTLILLVKIFFKQYQQKRKKVLMVTSLALMCFIVFCLPLSILSIIIYSILKINDLNSLVDTLLAISLIEIKSMVDFILTNAYIIHPWIQSIIILALLSNICIAINSSINPILYFLAGRNKERSRVSMKLALHRLLRNEEEFNKRNGS
ncbi:mas-related G-protein coupled receptor member H-like [Pseudonaja textilis]|uniref:mas-related G-protein coupled receptor member H-like n=1 Tax=Pseudonaja textilis TaxID=8673 RepID=UPI000EA94964|nr:mas-related G-protein coupled receptor member H-like [Pseudonaja textilis]